MEPLKLDLSFDAVTALLALGEVLDGRRNLIVESSGSTGTPKQIKLTSAALNKAAMASATRLGGHGQWLLALPITYVAGTMVLVRSLLADSQPVVLNTNVPFTAEGFNRTASFMSAERRYTSLVPAQLERLVSELDNVPGLLQTLKRFTAILVGGQAAKAKTIETLRAQGVNIVLTYGMAETCGGVVYNGVPLDGYEVTLQDDGRIVIDGIVTNDLGEFVEGKLVVKGRADRVINSGGHKLSLEAVEAWTLEQRGVVDAAAVAASHEEFGEAFVCFYTKSAEFELETSRAALTLGIVAKSGQWRSIEKLPTLPNGKPDLQFLTVLANQFGDNLGQ
jgi:O-succinylbenzoic acid--CoA ligase